MAKLPIEIVRIGNKYSKNIETVIDLLNQTQKEISYSLLNSSEEEKFQVLDFKDANCNELIGSIKQVRNELKGYHPYLIAITNASLNNGEYANLFGTCFSEDGLAIFTFDKVPDIIIPEDRIDSYIAYYLARYTFNFLIPDHHNHFDTRGCAFDFKERKKDIEESMKAGALCDECRSVVINPVYSISPAQFTSINQMFALSGDLLNKNQIETETKAKKPKLFIGSSVEGIDVARKIQNDLIHDFEVVIWNQGIFDRLGLSFLEILEETVNTFDYGVFIFTPDDTIESRGETKKIARDNVIFGLGMFVGKLSRKRAFLIHPKNLDLHILSDFNGITKASYESDATNLQAALGPVCDQIRTSIK